MLYFVQIHAAVNILVILELLTAAYDQLLIFTLSSDNFTNCEPGHIIPVKRENCSNVIFPVKHHSLVHLSGLQKRPVYVCL